MRTDTETDYADEYRKLVAAALAMAGMLVWAIYAC